MSTNTTTATAEPILTFKDVYYGKGIVIEVVPGTIVFLITQIVGFFANTCVILAAMKHKFGTCGILLSLGALGDILHQLSHYYMGYLMLSGKVFTRLATCVYVNIIPVIGLNIGVFMILFIAIDRLISVLLPMRHRQVNKIMYIGGYVLITGAYCTYMAVEMLRGAAATPDLVTTCLIIESLPGSLGQTWFATCLAANIATILCYVTVGIVLRITTNTSESTRRMFKSLTVITVIVFLGWAINAALQTVLILTKANPVFSWFCRFYAGIPVNIACDCNYFVLFVFSKDYRFAFRQQLNSITNIFVKKQFFSVISSRIRNITQAWTSSAY